MHVSLDPARAGLDPMANLGLQPGLAGLGLGPRAFSHADLHNFSNAHAELNPYASQNDIAGLTAAQASRLSIDTRSATLHLCSWPSSRTARNRHRLHLLCVNAIAQLHRVKATIVLTQPYNDVP